MRTASRTIPGRLILLLPILLLAGNLQAGTRAKVPGEARDVIEQVDVAFDELDLDTRPIQLEDDWSGAVGMNGQGIRLTLTMEGLGEDECNADEFRAESVDDASIEERYLRLMQSR